MTTQLLDETGHVELIVPDCPYCDKPLDGSTVNGNMHTECARKFNEEQNFFDLQRGPVRIDE